MTDIDTLSKLAGEATSGPWGAQGHHAFASSSSGERRGGMRVGMFPNVATCGREDDAAFIAAASPDTVLRICSELRLLRAVADAARPLAGKHRKALTAALAALDGGAK